MSWSWPRSGASRVKECFRSRCGLDRKRTPINFTMEHSSGRKHDVHAIPPQAICDLYRHYQKLDNALIDADVDIVDFRRGLTPEQQERIVPVDTVSAETLVAAERAFRTAHGADGAVKDAVPPCTIYEHKDFQGI